MNLASVGHLVFLACITTSQPATFNGDDRLYARIRYDYQILIASSDDEVALFHFRKIGEQQAEYAFRLLSNGKLTKGTGTVQIKIVQKIPGKTPNKFTEKFDLDLARLKAGKIAIAWQPSSGEEGHIFYVPELLTVQVADPLYFDHLDLKRFKKTQPRKTKDP